MADDLAIVGIACTLPDAPNVDAFWDNLQNKKNSIRQVPNNRWNVKKYLNAEGKKGTMYSAFGSFVEDLEFFDPTPFRGLSPTEVAAMDPQQRWVLANAWEAFEDAGVDVYTEMNGSKTGVYVAMMNTDYSGHLNDLEDIEQANNTFATGSSASICSNRVSYMFNLQGPSMTLDTACSSAITAMHLACQAIRTGDCEGALVAGVNLILGPSTYILLATAKMMSRTGGCKAFDQSGDGYTRGEGCGVVYIKRLSDAIRDNNKIYCIIKGTGINCDGKTQVPMTSPSEEMQFQLMKDVYAKTGVDPATINYIESHGTGTPVGDPVEARAIGRFLGKGSGREDKLLVGSVKTNIGHLESGSGIAGLLKICLMMKHKMIAPNLHFSNPNPTIPFEDLQIQIPSQLIPWEVPASGVRRAALNSFGFGGTNAHTILEEYIPPQKKTDVSEMLTQNYAIAFSAVENSLLKDTAVALQKMIVNQPELKLEDIAYSSLSHTHFKERVCLLPTSKDHAIELLSAFGDDGKVADLEKQGYLCKGSTQGDKRICFVFTGQGTYWAGMAKVLFTQPVFVQGIEAVDQYLIPLANWSVKKYLEENTDDSAPITQYTATVGIFAMQIALSRLLASWNIKPDFIVGHSVGETAAAVVSGAVTLEQGVRLVHHRARLQSTLEGTGRIAACAISPEEAQTLLAPYGGKITIAAINSPTSITIAGDTTALLDFEAKFKEANPTKMLIFLRLNSPYHTSYMDPIREEFLAACGDIVPQTPHTTIYSTVTGKKAEAGAYSGQYFWDNIRLPVLAANAIQNISKENNCSIFLEVGPHPALQQNLIQCNKEYSPKKNWHIIGTLNKKEPKWSAVLRCLSRLHLASVPVNWKAFFDMYKPSHVSMPQYPYQKKRYWIQGPHCTYVKFTETKAGFGSANASSSSHPLLRNPLPGQQGYQVECDPEELPYLRDHEIMGSLIIPFTFMVEYTMAAAQQMLADPNTAVGAYFVVENPVVVLPQNIPTIKLELESHKSLSLGDKIPFKFLQSSKEIKDTASGRGHLYSVPKEPHPHLLETANKIIDMFQAKSGDFETMAGPDLYKLVSKDYTFGPAHQGVTRAWWNHAKNRACGLLEVPEVLAETVGDYYVHPALLDAIFHPSIMTRSDNTILVPANMQVVFYNKPKSTRMWAVFKNTKVIHKGAFSEIYLLDEDRKTIIMYFAEVTVKQLGSTSNSVTAYEQVWSPAGKTDINPGFFAKPKNILVFASRNDLGTKFLEKIRSLNKSSQIVSVLTSDKKGHFAAIKNGYEVDPYNESGMKTILDKTVNGKDNWDAIIYMWGTEETDLQNTTKLGFKTCAGFLHLIKPLLNGSKATYPRIIGVTSGAVAISGKEEKLNVGQTTLWGFARSAILEYPNLKLEMIDLDHDQTDIEGVVVELTSSEDHCDEVAFRGGRCFRNVIQPTNSGSLPLGADGSSAANSGLSMVDSLVMNVSHYNGQFQFSANPDMAIPAPNHIQIKTTFCGVLPDALAKSIPVLPQGNVATVCVVGKAENNSPDFQKGADVISIGLHNFANHLSVNNAALIRKPKKWTDAQAATIPATLATAQFILHYLAFVRKQDSVLIVDDVAGVGLACAMLAKKVTPFVYMLCADQQKLKAAQAVYANALLLNNSKSSTQYVWGADSRPDRSTNPRFDVVISFAKDNTILGNVELKPMARYVGLNKNKNLASNVHQSQIDLGFFAIEEIVADLVKSIAPVLDEAPVKHMSVDQHPISEINNLNFAAAKSPIAIDYTRIENIPISTVNNIPLFRRSGTYVVIGGLRGLGLATAMWAVVNSARHIVLVGRSKPDADAVKTINVMKAHGAKVEVILGSITDETFVKNMFAKIKKEMPPIRGIVHSAVVLMDRLVMKHDWSEFEQVLSPKIEGGWLLHKYSQDQPLDFFVMYSSMTSFMGNPGQTAYGAGNAFLDALAQHRKLLGLPAISFNWGGISGVGVLARADSSVADMMDKSGSTLLTPAEVLSTLGDNLYSLRNHLAVMRMEWNAYFAANSTLPTRTRYKTLSDMAASELKMGGGAAKGQAEILRAIRAAPEDAQTIVEEFLQNYFMKMLEYSSPPDIDVPIQHLGIESVLASQMRVHIQNELSVAMPVVWFFSNITIGELAKRLLEIVPPAEDEEEETQPEPEKPQSKVGETEGEAGETKKETEGESDRYEADGADEILVEETDGASLTKSQNVIISDLSINQMSIYHVSPPGSIDMNLYGYVMFPFVPQGNILHDMIQCAADHHPILKSSYQVRNKKVVQIVDLDAKAYVETIDASNMTQEEIEAAVKVKAHIPFDLTKGQLIKTYLFMGKDKMTISLVFHHLIVDLKSCFIFFEDIMKMWASKQRLPKKEVVEHDEFVEWEKKWILSPEGKRAAEFWRSQITNAKSLHSLDLKLKQVNLTVPKGITAHVFHLTEEQHAGLSQLTKSLSTTPFILLWVAYQIFIVKASGKFGNVSMGTVFTTRPMKDTERVIGAYVNCLPLITSIEKEDTLRAMVARSTPTLTSCVDHSGYHNSLVPKPPGNVNLLQHMIIDDRVSYHKQISQLVAKMKFDTVSTNEETQLKILSELEDSNKIWGQLLLRNDFFDESAQETYSNLFKSIVNDMCTKPNAADLTVDKMGL